LETTALKTLRAYGLIALAYLATVLTSLLDRIDQATNVTTLRIGALSRSVPVPVKQAGLVVSYVLFGLLAVILGLIFIPITAFGKGVSAGAGVFLELVEMLGGELSELRANLRRAGQDTSVLVQPQVSLTNVA
jgi:hypothetical protein